MSELVSIGKITGVFGIKGELKVRSTVDDGVFKGLTELFVDKNALRLRSVRTHKGVWLLAFQGLDTPEDAALLIGKNVSVKTTQLPRPAANEVYWADIEGAKVVDTDGEKVGILADYIETGSHDVFEIKDGDKSWLVSNNPEHVKAIDAVNKIITVSRLGLVEGN